jgi:hypothetical protein
MLRDARAARRPVSASHKLASFCQLFRFRSDPPPDHAAVTGFILAKWAAREGKPRTARFDVNPAPSADRLLTIASLFPRQAATSVRRTQPRPFPQAKFFRRLQRGFRHWGENLLPVSFGFEGRFQRSHQPLDVLSCGDHTDLTAPVGAFPSSFFALITAKTQPSSAVPRAAFVALINVRQGRWGPTNTGVRGYRN